MHARIPSQPTTSLIRDEENANVRALAVDKLRRAASLPRRRPTVDNRKPLINHDKQDQYQDLHRQGLQQDHQPQHHDINSPPSSPASTTIYEPVEDYHDSDYDSDGNLIRETGQEVQVKDGNKSYTFSIIENKNNSNSAYNLNDDNINNEDQLNVNNLINDNLNKATLTKQQRALLTLSQLQTQLLTKHGNSILSRSNSATARVNAFNKLIGQSQQQQIKENNERPSSRLLRSNTVSGAVGGRGSRDDARQAARANMLKRLNSRKELNENKFKRRSSVGDISEFSKKNNINDLNNNNSNNNLLLVPPLNKETLLKKPSIESNLSSQFGAPSSVGNGDKFEFERILSGDKNDNVNNDVVSDDDESSIEYEEVEEEIDEVKDYNMNKRRHVHFTPSAYVEELRKTLGPDRLIQLLGPQLVNELGFDNNSVINDNNDDPQLDGNLNVNDEVIEEVDDLIDEDKPLSQQQFTTTSSIYWKPQPQIHMAQNNANEARSQANLTRSMTTLPKMSYRLSEKEGRISNHKKVKSQRSFGSIRGYLKPKNSVSKMQLQSNKEMYEEDPKLKPFPALIDKQKEQNNVNKIVPNNRTSRNINNNHADNESEKKLERKGSKMGQRLKRLFSIKKN